jgi:isoamylase
LNIAHPRVTQYVLDTLRFWVTQYGVDGFRFDLASVLGRTPQGFDTRAAFFTALLQDPVLAQIKLIAEPWDIGYGGYQLGHFPEPFLEWNDKFRDSMRRFWLQGTVGRGEFARRLMASSDVFHRGHRTPSASVNYVSAHDGFTLHDMVSYKHKHNGANGEENRDGRDAEPSTNCGVEGPSSDPQIIATRRQLQRTLLGTLLLSRGTPMLRAGDELDQTQQGNNNVYCQDNALSWIDWQSADQDLLAFTRKVIELRNRWPQIGPDAWPPDAQIAWLGASAQGLSTDDWHDPNHKLLAVLIKSPTDTGGAVWMAFNAGQRSEHFHLPPGNWTLLLDSALRDHGVDHGLICGQTTVLPHSMLVLGALE